MGGDVEVRSVHGKGSTFTVRLPVRIEGRAEGPAEVAADASATAASPEGSRTPAAGSTVLVIDDDPATRDLMVQILRREGYRATSAAGGEEGLLLARKLRPAAITLDVVMPGKDGWAVLGELKADPELSDIPVIMVTILDDSNLGYALGATEFITKPVDRSRLSAVLSRYRAAGKAGSVLVVDDEADTRELLRRVLVHDGWEVTGAENGRVALERIAAGRPDLILLDLMMPEMDGFEFVERLRRDVRGPSIPIVVVTAKDITEEDRRRLNHSVQKILQKGAYTHEEVLKVIRELVGPETGGGKGGRPA
jgi:CheY-like chemotaxis protein